jgi:endonuclease G, mitochondrial
LNHEKNTFYNGYQKGFLGADLQLPKLNTSQEKDCTAIADNNETIIPYVNYSVQLSKARMFPYFTASNIDRNLFKKAP